MKFSILLFFVMIAIGFADQPVHCVYEQILGTWTFYAGDGELDNLKLDCSDFDPGRDAIVKVSFELVEPNLVKDATGYFLEGVTWTMVYDQGFEVKGLIGNTWWANNAWDVNANGTVTSHCYKTQTGRGWFHAKDAVKPKHGGCYYGEKERQTPETKTTHTVREKPENQLKRYGQVLSDVQIRDKVHAVKDERPDYIKYKDLPDNFDWRNNSGIDYVGVIRDQSACGSCYAFASIAVMESRLRISRHQNNMDTDEIPILLSTQDPVSCNRYTEGCDGGFAYLVGKYAQEFGVVELRCMAYEWNDVPCYYKCNDTKLVHYFHDQKYVGGYYGNCSEVEMMKTILNEGPIAVGVEVTREFQQYTTGIFGAPSYQKQDLDDDEIDFFEATNHAVTLVGWGVDDETHEKYWILRNSWGVAWGERGYMRIYRGSDIAAVESMGLTMTYIL